jgi:CubicO group peptidase (beta-lactamase class C family)
MPTQRVHQFGIVFTSQEEAMNFETVSPESVGLSSARLLKAKDYAQRVGDQLGSSGGAVLVTRQDKIVGEWYWGRRSPSPDAPAYDQNTLTPLMSITKGLTATALALLIQDGVLWLDEPVSSYFSEFKERDLAKVTVRHLATHSSGLPGGDIDFYSCWQDQRPGETLPETYFRHAMGRVVRGVVFEPGTWHVYSDIAVTILGEVIYRASGERVPDIIRQRVFEPLGLRRIGWDFDDELAKDIASIVNDDWMGGRHGSKEARQAGSVAGGLISNARDLATFGCLLLHEGTLNGVRILAPLTVRMMTTCQYPLPGRPNYLHRGLLWWIKTAPDTPELGNLVPNGTYCHGGAGHSVLVIIPGLDIVAVMIRNRIGDPPGFIYNRDYPVFMDLVAAAVDKL